MAYLTIAEDKILEGLTEIGNFMANAFQLEVLARNKFATGRLADSAMSEVRYSGTGAVVETSALKYAWYINQGRKPGFPSGGDGSFLVALTDWVKVKGIERDDRQAKSVAYAIRQNIFKNGIRPVPIIDVSVKVVEDNMDRLIDENIGILIRQGINKAFNDNAD